MRYDRGGLEFALRLDGIGVYDEGGRLLRHEISYPGRYVRIKAWVPGAADTKKTVTLVYRVRRGLLTFESHDELYWNATGDEWEVPIQHAEVYVNTLPGVSDKTMRKLVEAGFDTAEKIAEATVDALSEVQGIGLKTAERIIGAARGEQVAEPAEAEAGAKTE